MEIALALLKNVSKWQELENTAIWWLNEKQQLEKRKVCTPSTGYLIQLFVNNNKNRLHKN